MDVGDHRASAGNSYMCIDYEFRLGMQSYNESNAEAMGHTLKT